MDLESVSGAADREHHGRYPLRDAVVEARYRVGRRVARHTVGRYRRRCIICARPFLWRLHDQPAAGGPHGRAGMDRIPFRRRRSGAGTRWPRPAARPASVLLEERQVGARHHVARSGRTRLLGGLWLPQLRRSMAGTAVPGRLSWKVCRVVALRDETATARTIVLQVPDWPG